VGPDGSIVVGDDAHEAPDVDRIIRVDPANGDRSVVSSADVGTGPEMRNPAGLAVEPTGSLACADGLLDALLRVDPATGDRTVVSDESVGSGRPFGWIQAVAVEEDATLVTLDSFREVFCVPLCPHPLCVYCLTNAPTVFRVDPVDGDRTLVSGGGTCLMAGDGTCQTPYFGRRGRGPDLQFPQGIAVESPRSFVVADFDQVVRVDAVRGRRTVLATIAPPAASRSAAARPQRQDRLRRLSSLDARRVHRPQDPAAWLRRAVGTAGDVRGRPEDLFRGLTPERRRALGERLYAALWETMRAVLGADHPDTRAATPARPGRRPAEE
jgi:hypothetical protein